jgi:hypothetical protein
MISAALQFSFEKPTLEGKITFVLIIALIIGFAMWAALKDRK